MRVSRTQAEENRQTVINTASRLFRQHGFDGIGLKDLMKEAGLTQGAFYKQFESKEDLAAQASDRALESASQRWSAEAAKHPHDPLGAVIALFLSEGHCQEKMDGCPIVALGSDAARQSSEVKASFQAGILAHLEVLGRMMGGTGDKEAKDKAIAVLSTLVGAVTLSRMVNDPGLSRAILKGAAKQVRKIAPVEKPNQKGDHHE